MIAIACDHAGIDLKPTVISVLDELGIPYKDFGTHKRESCDYPIYAARAAKAVADGECDRGILICGTGIGISIAANKVQGIRAAVVTNEFMAEMCKAHNDANIISFGGRVITIEEAIRFTDIWLDTETEMGRHAERRAMTEA